MSTNVLTKPSFTYEPSAEFYKYQKLIVEVYEEMVREEPIWREFKQNPLDVLEKYGFRFSEEVDSRMIPNQKYILNASIPTEFNLDTYHILKYSKDETHKDLLEKSNDWFTCEITKAALVAGFIGASAVVAIGLAAIATAILGGAAVASAVATFGTSLIAFVAGFTGIPAAVVTIIVSGLFAGGIVLAVENLLLGLAEGCAKNLGCC